LTAVQLHAGFDPALVRRLHKSLEEKVRIIQTVHWVVSGEESSEAEVAAKLDEIAQEPAVDRVLVDSKVGAAMGGTGVAFDWAAAQSIFSAKADGAKLILAGGLRPENVAEAIRQLHPWGVDVASGVEAHAGRKDRVKMSQFIQGAKGLR